MQEKIDTKIPGCFIVKPRILSDNRGDFIKIFNEDFFRDLDLRTDFREMYYSLSTVGVIRGLHFQEPPEQHVKYVACLKGKIFDVVVDLRKGSPTYNQHESFLIDSKNPYLIYIPEGIAHGFMSLTDDTIFLNKTTTVYNPDCDSGIHWDSCGIKWPMAPLLVSDKDKSLPKLSEFDSPFKF